MERKFLCEWYFLNELKHDFIFVVDFFSKTSSMEFDGKCEKVIEIWMNELTVDMDNQDVNTQQS